MSKISKTGIYVGEKTESALAAVQAALDEVNGRARSFVLKHASIVFDTAEVAEIELEERFLTQRERVGATVTYIPAGPSANAYRNSAQSTKITLTRRTKGWYLTAVERTQVWPRNPIKMHIKATAEAAKTAAVRVAGALGHQISIA
jgi:hypothetical protein